MFKTSLKNNELADYVSKQVSASFPDREIGSKDLLSSVSETLERTEYCFSHVNNKYFFDGKSSMFSHLHSDQYAMFLYYLANTIWKEQENAELASKVYYLNKSLHGIDAYYEVNLPNIFLLVHPLGAVLGRAEYSNYFVAYQRVTVGGDKDLNYPCLQEGLAMYAGSALIGNCKVGKNCLISAGTTVLGADIPPDMVVFGKNPEISSKKTSKSVIERYFIA